VFRSGEKERGKDRNQKDKSTNQQLVGQQKKLKNSAEKNDGVRNEERDDCSDHSKKGNNHKAEGTFVALFQDRAEKHNWRRRLKTWEKSKSTSQKGGEKRLKIGPKRHPKKVEIQTNNNRKREENGQGGRGKAFQRGTLPKARKAQPSGGTKKTTDLLRKGRSPDSGGKTPKRGTGKRATLGKKKGAVPVVPWPRDDGTGCRRGKENPCRRKTGSKKNRSQRCPGRMALLAQHKQTRRGKREKGLKKNQNWAKG